MSSGLEARLERLQEAVDPQPATMTTVVIVRYEGIADPAMVTTPNHYLGQYATCCFLGGTEKERRQELKRLRASGEYDHDPCIRAIGEGADEAIEGS